MSFITLMILVAMLPVVVTLVWGVSSMVTDGQVQHLDSNQWMIRRVAFQAAAFLLVLLAIYLAR